jgi:OmpR family response regulator RpaB
VVNILEDYKEKILIIDNEVSICQILDTRLTLSGYTVFIAKDGKEAITIFKEKRPDLVVLDIILPKTDGYQVYSELKKELNVPIIILTVLSDISDKIMGLEFGADDYITKPFSPKELETRIRIVLRRTNKKEYKANNCLFYIGNLFIDTNKRRIFKDKKQLHLTEIEFSLIELFLFNAGKKLSRSYILNNIWGYIPIRYLDTRIVDVHISRLRAKLEDDINNPHLILTVRGIGYMFQNFKNISN